MKNTLLLVFVLVSTVTFSQNETKQMISIAKGETVIVNQTTIKFVKVLEDSRCPKNATCIWQGRAKIQIEIEDNKGQQTTKEIIFGALRGSERANKTFINEETYFIEAVTLKPYPVVGTNKGEYVLWICKGK